MRSPTSSASSTAEAASRAVSSISSPPARRVLFAATSPSTRTSPSRSSRSAWEREPTSGRLARNRSSRSPAASLGAVTVNLEGSDASRLTVSEEQRADQHGDTGDDEGVREVERRPEAEVEEVRDVSEADAVDE